MSTDNLEVIAKTIKDKLTSTQYQSIMENPMRAAEYLAIKTLALDLANNLFNSNPNFNTAMWLRDCGIA